METQNTAKNFALQLGSLVALYVSVASILVILFGIITLSFPDAADSYWRYENAVESVRFSIAVLIVFFPTYIILTRIVNTIRRKEHGTYLTLTKWLIYLTLLAGGAVILGDFVALINGFLNGDLTIRFGLKVLSMFVIVGAAFIYYLFDVKGYWQTHERRSIQYAVVATVIVVATLVVGFQNIETPSVVREMKIDDEQINDLQSMSWRIEEYYQVKEVLPETLSELYTGMGVSIPTASVERNEYAYAVIDSDTYQLCAEFAFSSEKELKKYEVEPMYLEDSIARQSYSWDHGEGDWCFERVVSDRLVPKHF